MKLSIIIPAYNEEKTILEVVECVKSVTLPPEFKSREIVIVDDFSTDKTGEILQAYNDPEISYYRHEKNRGKGRALATGIKESTGDIILIQDADLEYNPHEYPLLLAPFLENDADVVYGSRYKGGSRSRVLFYWHSQGNQLLTALSNFYSNLYLTDMETCYKVFKAEIIKGITIEEDRFGFEPEVTAKLASLSEKTPLNMYEVGVSYTGRSYDEGKKIGARDGFRALWCILKYNTTLLAQFSRYMLSGTLIATTQLLVLVALMNVIVLDTTLLQANISNIIAIEFSLLVAFFLHRGFTWERDKQTDRNSFVAYLKFHGVSLVNVGIRVGLFYYLSQLGFHYLQNALWGIVSVVAVNFLSYKFFLGKK